MRYVDSSSEPWPPIAAILPIWRSIRRISRPAWACQGTSSGWSSYDSAQGYNLNPSVNQKVNIASLGVGLRYNIKKDVSARFDIARVMDGVWPNGAPNIALEGDVRGHFGLAFGF